jgi:formylglycine-generating enzyme required for sulfatase activity
MDPTALIPLVTPIVKAVVDYIRNEGAQKAGEKALEKIGEKAGESVYDISGKSLEKLRSLFQKKDDKKAQKALQALEEDPHDDDYQHKLIKETARLAAADPAVAADLKTFAEHIERATINMPGSQLVQIEQMIINQHVQQPPTSQRPDHVLLREYLAHLWRTCNALSFGDPQGGKPGQSMELGEIFTMLRVHVQRTGEWQGKVPAAGDDLVQRRGRLNRALPVITTLSQEHVSVLLGVPGGGKSTVVAFLALALAEAQREFPSEGGGLERLGADWQAGPLIPVRVRVGDVTRSLWEGIPELQHDHFNKAERARLIEILEQRLSNGTAMMLIDGLDEVADSRLAIVLQLIADARVRFGRSHIVVTCRSFDYRTDPERRIPDLPELELQPLDRDDQERFVNLWYRELARKRDWGVAEAQDKRDDLLVALRDREEIAELAETPLLLSMTTLVHTEEGILPPSRALLYQRCVRLLLVRWRQESSAVLDESDMLLLAAELGYLMHSEEQRQGDAFRGLTRKQIRDAALEFFERSMRSNNEAEQRRVEELGAAAARRLLNSNGLLLGVGGNCYDFAHRTLKEFLAGQYLGVGSRRKQVLDHAVDPWWRGALCLMAGYGARDGDTTHVLGMIEKLVERSTDEQLLAAEMLAEVGEQTLRNKQYDDVFEEDGLWPSVINKLRQFAFSNAPLCPDARLRNRAATLLDRLGADNRPELDLLDPRYWAELIPPGPFVMGDDNGQEDSEKPAFVFNICYPYHLARFPVTNRQYKQFLKTCWERGEDRRPPDHWPGRSYRAGEGSYPVVEVEWENACAFTKWANDLLHEKGLVHPDEEVGLPTEPEWERAAAYPQCIPTNDPSAGKRTYPWGDWLADVTATTGGKINTAIQANIDESGIGGTSVVGIFPHGAAHCGAQDMAGNVVEWCATAWPRDYANYPRSSEELIVKEKLVDEIIIVVQNRWYRINIVVRGGSWFMDRILARCAYRSAPNCSLDQIGFRLARRS